MFIKFDTNLCHCRRSVS